MVRPTRPPPQRPAVRAGAAPRARALIATAPARSSQRPRQPPNLHNPHHTHPHAHRPHPVRAPVPRALSPPAFISTFTSAATSASGSVTAQHQRSRPSIVVPSPSPPPSPAALTRRSARIASSPSLSLPPLPAHPPVLPRSRSRHAPPRPSSLPGPRSAASRPHPRPPPTCSTDARRTVPDAHTSRAHESAPSTLTHPHRTHRTRRMSGRVPALLWPASPLPHVARAPAAAAPTAAAAHCSCSL